MFKFINRLFNNKIIATIDSNDINIIKTDSKHDTNIRKIIKTFDRELKITDISLMNDNVYIPHSIYLCNNDIIIKGDKYSWKLNSKHFSKEAIEYVWKETFEFVTIWNDEVDVSLKITIDYLDGNTDILDIKSIKGAGDKYTHNFKWE